jgi:transposase-like protein
MTKKIRRYSEAFKRQVVAEYEAGNNISDLAKRYGITGGMTIKYWIKKYAKDGFRHELVRIQTTEEANRVRELELQVKELEQALGRVMLEKLKLESILEVLQEKEVDIVKKNELPSSSDFTGKSSKENDR